MTRPHASMVARALHAIDDGLPPRRLEALALAKEVRRLRGALNEAGALLELAAIGGLDPRIAAAAGRCARAFALGDAPDTPPDPTGRTLERLCPGGCSLWRCARPADHPGPCHPEARS